MRRTHSGCLAAGGLTRDPTSRVVSSASKASVSLHSNMPTSATAEIEEGNLTKPGESALPHSISTTVESCVPRLDTDSLPSSLDFDDGRVVGPQVGHARDAPSDAGELARERLTRHVQHRSQDAGGERSSLGLCTFAVQGVARLA